MALLLIFAGARIDFDAGMLGAAAAYVIFLERREEAAGLPACRAAFPLPRNFGLMLDRAWRRRHRNRADLFRAQDGLADVANLLLLVTADLLGAELLSLTVASASGAAMKRLIAVAVIDCASCLGAAARRSGHRAAHHRARAWLHARRRVGHRRGPAPFPPPAADRLSAVRRFVGPYLGNVITEPMARQLQADQRDRDDAHRVHRRADAELRAAGPAGRRASCG